MSMLVQHLAKAALSAPLFGPPPTNDRGAHLDLQTHRILTILEKVGERSWSELGPERARRDMRSRARLASVAPLPVHAIEERRIETPAADLRARIYRPRESDAPLPATVYFHGGGFVLGDLDTHDAICRHLAVRSGSTVVSVDYRLAPEYPFPCATDDAWAAFRWTAENASELGIDAARIAVAGDSAGGNLATVVAQLSREDGPRPAFQLLIYPAVDLTRSSDSHRTFASGFFLTEAEMDWFLANYLSNPAQTRDPRASPLLTRDLGGLPPAHVVTAGFDPLRDEGEGYADALRAAGVPTTSRCYDTLIHGFASMGGLIDAARHALDDLGEVLRRALWP